MLLNKKERGPKVPLLMSSQRKNPYCELLQICSANLAQSVYLSKFFIRKNVTTCLYFFYICKK